MAATEEKIHIANWIREIKEAYDYKCYYCREDFRNKPYLLFIHHRDFLGYVRLINRNPFKRKIVKPVCAKCHCHIHVAAAIITFGLQKSIPIKFIRDILSEEIVLNRKLVNHVIRDLREIGVSKERVKHAKSSTIYRILNYSLKDDLYEKILFRIQKAMPSLQHLAEIFSQ
jgi:hypothetical protein